MISTPNHSNMPQTKSIKVYTFDELTGKAKEKAADWLRNLQADMFGEDDCLLTEWKKKLERMGYQNPKIAYSGFWSQGDGASFTATVDLVKWLKQTKNIDAPKSFLDLINEGEISAEIEKNQWGNQHSHSKTVQASVHANAPESFDNLINTIEDQLTEEVRGLSDKIYHNLRDEYEYQTSDESIKACAEANEDLFDRFGDIFTE